MSKTWQSFYETPDTKLNRLLVEILGDGKADKAEMFVRLIQEMISDTCNDTEHRINRTGEYDPDF